MKPGFFRHLVDSMVVGLAVQDEEGRLVYVNRAFAEMLGYEPEELVGQASRVFFTADGRDKFDTQLGLREEGVSAPFETFVKAKGGEELIRISPQPMFDEDGRFAGSFATCTIIGETRRTEVESQVMSEIARGVAITDNLDDLLKLIHDCLKRVVYAENLYVALYDPAEETISFPYFVDQQDEPPAPLPRGRSCTDYVLRTGQALLLTDDLFEDLLARGEIQLLGSPSPSWLGVPLKTPDKTIGVLAVQHYEDKGAFSERDLELCVSIAGHIALAIEKKRSDEALQESQQFLTSVVESMSDGVVVINPDFQMVYINRAMEETIRTPRKEVLNSDKPVWELLPHLLEVGAAEMIQRSMQGETLRAEAVPFRLPDGTKGWVNEIYQPVLRANGEIRGVLAVVRDVTHHLQAEEELATKEEQLQHAQKMEAVGRLAGGVAHDFNNQLTAINGFAELVLGDLPTDSPQRELVKEIRDAGSRAATLTQKLLALSRKQVVKPRPVELNSLIERFKPVLERLAGEHIEVVTRLASEPLRTVLDPSQAEQVVLNLVVNGLDAMPSGGRLEIRMLRQQLDDHSAAHAIAAGPYVGFEIRDTGIGMNEETQAQIFEPFFTTKVMGKGTGLGLAIVYGIVKQNDGYVWVESELGKGTCCRVFFPQSAEAASSFVKLATTMAQPRGSATLLVVEDERGVRSLIGRILRRQGYRVVESSSAAQALEAVGNSEVRFDMVITDVVMPHMSGPELARRLARAEPALKVLFISGHLGETMENQGLIENAALLAKPFTSDALLDKVRRMLEDGGQQRAV